MAFLSSSVLRRYTPPTCTLEIVAKDSPLSRWAGRPILRQLKFQLSLDDPRLSEAEQVTLRGDRDQLDELAEAVSAYVQDFLQQSPSLLYSALRSPTLGSINEDASDQIRDRETGSGATATLSLVNPGDFQEPAAEATAFGESNVIPLPPAPLILQAPQISLQPEGLLSHKLILGSLATATSGPHLILSSLQLSDLATALDEYLADAMSLPELNRIRAVPSIPTWARTAAMLVLTAGVTAATVKLFDRPEPALQTAVSLTTPQTANQTAIANGQPGGQTLGVPSPPLLSQQTLPPPPPTGAIASSKLPGVAVPGTTTSPQISISKPSALPAPINIQPQEAPSAKQAPSVEIEQAPVVAIAPPPPPESATRQAPAPSESSEPEPPNAEADSSEAAIASSRLAEEPQNSANVAGGSAADSAATTTAFDSIPQVSEVRTYFQDRWQPPEGLTQTLEYTISLGPDGSIQRIVPLGQSAGDYIDRTGMPLVGEPFVTPLQGNQNPKVRVVLSPDGQVRTFLESPN